MPWEAIDIITYLSIYDGEIRVKNLTPYLVFPRLSQAEAKPLVDTILPHLSARRAEVLALLYPTENQTPCITKPDPFADPQDPAERIFVQVEHLTQSTEKTRERILTQVRAEGTKAGKPVWLLLRHGTPVIDRGESTKRQKKRKTPHTPPHREATHVCVEGAAAWTKLPKVTTHEEDVRIARKSPKPKAKRREGK